MSKLATPARFNGGWYTQYRRYDFFALRAQITGNRFGQLKNSKVLIAGCGTGYLVDELTNQGFGDVWGCDASAWVIDQGKALLPGVASRLFVSDPIGWTNNTARNAVRSVVGLSGNNAFNLIITEDMLPCADHETEAQSMLTGLRSMRQTMLHVITCGNPTDTKLQPSFGAAED